MTTTTHTPGPWTTCDSELWGHHEQSVMVYSSVEYEDGDADVAEVCGKSNALERAANVRLVAASPTMYDYIADRANEGDERAKAIIAKVKGAKS